MKFFVPTEIYEDRIKICKECVYYFKPTGSCKVCKCFMKIKARLAPMSCPQKYWLQTSLIETPEDLPDDLISDIKDVWNTIKTGKAKDIESKKKMIELYNAIHNTNFSNKTNCGSCLSACWDGIKRLYEKYYGY